MSFFLTSDTFHQERSLTRQPQGARSPGVLPAPGLCAHHPSLRHLSRQVFLVFFLQQSQEVTWDPTDSGHMVNAD